MSEQPTVSVEPPIHGYSQALREALDDARVRAPGIAPVLILAEVGLEVPELGAHMHALSGRAGPFVALNAVELATHADSSARLRESIDRAQGGTLLIEEVGELPMFAQAILEALLHQQVRSPTSADVRVLVSTSLDLGELVDEGVFRAGLLQRLLFGTVALPPLRERSLDVGLLAERVLREHPYLPTRRVTGLEPSAVAALVDQEWPENLPELEAVIVYAAQHARGERLTDDDIELAILGLATTFSRLGPDTEGYVRARPLVPGLDEPAEQAQPDGAPVEATPLTVRRPTPRYDVAGLNVAERAFGPLQPVEVPPEEIRRSLNQLVDMAFRRLLTRIDEVGPIDLKEAAAVVKLKKRLTRSLLAVLVEDGMLSVSGAEGAETWSRPIEA